MEIQNNLVCSPEQALRLKNFGIIQESVFYYMPCPSPIKCRFWKIFLKSEINNSIKNNCVSAFSIAELGQAIDWNLLAIAAPYKDEKEWRLFSTDEDEDQHNESEVIARADALIRLLEKGKLKAEDVNNRLKPFSIFKSAV